MENLWEKIAINLADSQAPSLLVAEVDTAMNHNELVKLKVGDHIKWLGDDLCHSDQNGIEKLHLPHAAIGKVLQVSDNPLVQYVEKELGVHIGDASWALVQFQNGFRMVLRPPQKFQKIEAPAPLDPDWKPEEPEDYYKKETLGLEVGDWIIWQDEEFEILDEQVNPCIFPGMKGKVIKLVDGLAPYILDGRDTAVFPWALVEFENGQ